jgi:hypothetical protein
MFCFISLANNPGGVQSMEISIIENLYYRGIKCKLFDLEDGWVRSSLIRKNIGFIDNIIDSRKSNKDYSFLLSHEDILIVTNGLFFESILLFSNANCKILFWEVFYSWIERFISTRNLPIKKIANRIEIQILSILVNYNGIVFMDRLGREAVSRRLKKNIAGNYLPVPVKVPIANLYVKPINTTKKTFKISYIGRAEIWKMYPILKFIEDSNKTIYKHCIEFHIVTDNEDRFKSFFETRLMDKNVKIYFYENLNEQQIEEFLLATSDIHVAMGASALDGAKFGVPTVLIDFSFDAFPEKYLYRWIFETVGYDLGQNILQENFYSTNKHTISELFEKIIDESNEISQKCFNYVNGHHNINFVVDKLLDSYTENKTSLRMSHLSSLFITRCYKFLRLINQK